MARGVPMRVTGLIVVVLASLLAAPVNAATLEFQNVRVDTTGYPNMVAWFEIRVDHRELLSSLDTGSVKVKEGGQEVSGDLEKAGLKGGIAFVFVLDVSLSMRTMMSEVREAVAEFVEQLGPDDLAGLVTFHEDVNVPVDLTSDRAAVAAELRRINASGRRTEVFYGVTRGLDLLQRDGLPDRRVLVLVSDGRDEGSAYDIASCKEKADRIGASIMGIGIRTGTGTYWRNVERLSLETGGVFLPFEPGQKWREKFAAVRKNLESRWSFTWKTTTEADGNAHQATLIVQLGATSISQPIQYVAPNRPAPPPERPKTPWWVWVAGGVVLAGVAGGGWAYARARNRRREEMRTRQESERQRQEQLLGEIKQQVEQTGARVEGVEKQIQDSQSPTVIMAPPRSPGVRKGTIFSPSGATPAGPATRYRAGQVEIISGPLAGSRLPLAGQVIRLGRETDNNIVLDEERVSKYHAIIRIQDGFYWLEDQQSRNGTYVDDGPRLTAAVALRDGMLIRMGGVQLRFRGDL